MGKSYAVLYPGDSLGTLVLMERFNLFIQTIHCNIFKQARVADGSIMRSLIQHVWVYYLNQMFENV